MRIELLQQADHVLSALPPGRREAVREVVVDAVHRGGLSPSNRAFLTRATGSTFLADVLSEAIDERAEGVRRLEELRVADSADRVK